VARTTLQYWLARKKGLDAHPAVVAFFESPEGLAVLHAIVTAAHFAFTQVGPCGIRCLCLFLQMSRLDRFVAASFGAQQQVSASMQAALVRFGEQERARLAKQMAPKAISVAEDETFHPETCLVAIEPVSNFILLERYAERRDAASWTTAMAEALSPMPVTVLQATSDEARGLVAHVEQGLGAQHSPDLFHVQHEVSKGTCPALSAKARQADGLHEPARAQVQMWRQRRAAFDDPTRRRGPGRRPNFERRIEEAQKHEAAVVEGAQQARERQARMRAAIGGLADAYHPFAVRSGAARAPDLVRRELSRHVDDMRAVTQEAGLSQRCREHVEKAGRVVASMAATIAFFHLTVARWVGALRLATDIEQVVLEQLIPAFYLRRVAERAGTAERRRELLTVSQQLLARARDPASALARLSAEEREHVERVGAECADLFQRSSSCVEGRNGQLALRHHSLHRLSARKLEALTVVHNYFVTRADGTTPAERFFGAKPNDLGEWLLDQLDVPARPAQSRSRQKREAA